MISAHFVKKKMLSMLSIAYVSLLTIFCKIGYMFFPSQVHIFFLGRIVNVFSVTLKVDKKTSEELYDNGEAQRFDQVFWVLHYCSRIRTWKFEKEYMEFNFVEKLHCQPL
jgi:hypothetical protein